MKTTKDYETRQDRVNAKLLPLAKLNGFPTVDAMIQALLAKTTSRRDRHGRSVSRETIT